MQIPRFVACDHYRGFSNCFPFNAERQVCPSVFPDGSSRFPCSRFPCSRLLRILLGIPSLRCLTAHHLTPEKAFHRARIKYAQIGTGHAHADKIKAYLASDDYAVVGIAEPDPELQRKVQETDITATCLC